MKSEKAIQVALLLLLALTANFLSAQSSTSCGSQIYNSAVQVCVRGQVFDKTPLENYVYQPDPNYSYQVIPTSPAPSKQNYEKIVLLVKSLKWTPAGQLSSPLHQDQIWKHYLIIFKPKDVSKLKEQALFVINGGQNNANYAVEGNIPTDFDSALGPLAGMTNSIAAVFYQIPNQPYYKGSNMRDGLTEDDLLGATFNAWLASPDTVDFSTIALFPMVKAAVRGMDTVTDYLRKNGNISINKFVVGGASKRGWTSWLLSAIDNRVNGLVSIVFDALNIQQIFLNIFYQYCEFPALLRPYVLPDNMAGSSNQAIVQYYSTNVMSNARVRELYSMVDPFSYKARYVNLDFVFALAATRDEYFPSTSSLVYFSQIQARAKYLEYVPNVGHLLNADMSLLYSPISYYMGFLNGNEGPKVDILPVTYSADGTQATIAVRVLTSGAARVNTPSYANLWKAENPGNPDYRLTTLSSTYWDWSRVSESEVTIGGNTYVEYKSTIQSRKDAYGRQVYVAGMIELVFSRYSLFAPLKVTSNVVVVPRLSAPSASLSCINPTPFAQVQTRAV